MDDPTTVSVAIEKLLPQRLHRLQRSSGASAVFGGSTRPGPTGDQLVISRLVGTLGGSLRDLAVPAGRGLGGAVLRQRVPLRVNDYASTATITHDYDRIVVNEERFTSLIAVPIIVKDAVRGVLYGAVRERQPIGDRALSWAAAIADRLGKDVEDLLRPRPEPPSPALASAALAELADVMRSTTDPALRARLTRIYRDLGGRPDPPRTGVLAPRELDTLRLVAIGASNNQIAAQLGLSPETVKAYLRTAMRKLQARNRTAAVHAVRLAGLID
jgi:LuxR family transcriptional regulator, regulator of acetate metabolism